MKQDLNKVKQAWDKNSDTWYTRYRTEEAIAHLIEKPESTFHHTTWELIQKVLPDFRGKKICVPSSLKTPFRVAFLLF